MKFLILQDIKELLNMTCMVTPGMVKKGKGHINNMGLPPMQAEVSFVPQRLKRISYRKNQ